MGNVAGGLEAFVMNYYRVLVHMDIQFDFVCMYDKIAYEEEIRKLGGRIYYIPNVKKNYQGYIKELKKILKETKYDTTKHAEILAIQKASKKLNSWRLIDCEMYVTLEPCSMCAGALINSRIKKVYIGASDEKTGAVGSVFNLLDDYTFNHKVEYEKGVLEDECEGILKDFFKELRKIKSKK